MKIFRYAIAVAVFLAAICMVILAVKSWGRLDLKEQIKEDEIKIEVIETKRASANAMPIPFKSDTVRNKKLESANKKNGFKLSVRKSN
jgi:hypothetical protein